MTGPKIRALELVVCDADELDDDDEGCDVSAPVTLRGRALARHVAESLRSSLSGVEIARTGGYSVDRCAEMLIRSGYGRIAGGLVWRDYEEANVRSAGEYAAVLEEAEKDEALFAEEAAWLEYMAA